MSEGTDTHPTILDPSTCVKKGLCTVGQGRVVKAFRIYYELHGTLNGSQKMVLIMGLIHSSNAWISAVEHFSKKPEHSVLVFDNRGVGNSETGPFGRYKTSETAKDTAELLEFLGWTADRSVHLIGFSMGGMIAQELCLSIPKRFKSVSFHSTKAGYKKDLPPVKGLYMLARVMSHSVSEAKAVELLLGAQFPAEFLTQTTAEGRTTKEDMRDQISRRIRGTKKQPGVGEFGQVCAIVTHACSIKSLNKISRELEPAKIAVITGDQDQLIYPIRSVELHAALPGSEYVVFEGAGHTIHMQLPDQFHSLLERIMDEGNQAFSKV